MSEKFASHLQENCGSELDTSANVQAPTQHRQAYSKDIASPDTTIRPRLLPKDRQLDFYHLHNIQTNNKMASEKSDTHKQDGKALLFIPEYELITCAAQIKSADMVRTTQFAFLFLSNMCNRARRCSKRPSRSVCSPHPKCG
jgi:hypothetical protein